VRFYLNFCFFLIELETVNDYKFCWDDSFLNSNENAHRLTQIKNFIFERKSYMLAKL